MGCLTSNIYLIWKLDVLESCQIIDTDAMKIISDEISAYLNNKHSESSSLYKGLICSMAHAMGVLPDT